MARFEQRFRLQDASQNEADAAVEHLRKVLAPYGVKANVGGYERHELVVLLEVEAPNGDAKTRAIELLSRALDETPLEGKYQWSAAQEK